MLSKVFKMVLTITLTLFTTSMTTTATPLTNTALTNTTTPRPTTATLYQYLNSTACVNGETTVLTSTISLNQCIDIGSQENDMSIELLNLAVGTDIGEDEKCFGQVYEYAGCGTNEGDPSQGSYWRQGPVRDLGSGVCFQRVGFWADGQGGLGSVELVCVTV